MRRTSIIAAAIGSLVASSAFAGFSITASTPTAQGAKEAILFRTINDGTDTGTQLKAIDLQFTLTSGKAYFVIDDSDFDGTGDTVNISNGGNDLNNSFVRIGTAGQTFIVSSDPTGATVQPNPWLGGVSTFHVTATTTATVNATGAGALFARLVMDPGSAGTITGVMGGDLGNKVNVSGSWGSVTTPNAAPVIASVVNANVNFGTIVSTPLPFSATVNVTDADAADVLSLVAGTLPAGVTIGSITGGGSSPQSFVISGTVAYPGSNQTLTVPVTVADGAGLHSVGGSFDIVITPEPASLSLMGLGGLLLGRRRK